MANKPKKNDWHDDWGTIVLFLFLLLLGPWGLLAIASLWLWRWAWLARDKALTNHHRNR